MTERDFAYWLQGYFELTTPDQATLRTPALAPWQIDCIKRHLAFVRVTEKTPSALCVWIEGALAVGGPEAMDAIALRLSQHFEHVIDPQHPEPEKANAAHAGPGHTGNPIPRC